ncbi:MAG: cytochrome C [Acidobacteria bacterium]|nr:MAG: cytochrome C [Acidobacteriota bacterium]
MLRNSHARMVATFVCSLICVLATPARGQDPRQGRGGGGRGQVALPDGPGKEEVQTQCTKCHALGLIANAGGNTKQEWADLFGTMVKLSNDQRAAIAEYLGKNYPPQPRPQAVVVPGPLSVSFKEWNVPTLGSRPHDPEPGPGGTIWWTGMFANVLGRLDPKTGDVTEYKLPEEVRDPHTPLIAPSGTVFFTAQGANYVGRINPKTGEIKVQKTPTERANPYGMVFTSKGVPFVCDFGTNKIIEFDPETLAIKEYELPNPESRPRRIAISSDDIIWYADYSRGYLGRLDPKTGKVTDWPSPSGPRSQPYGITYLDGAIWYVESAIRPNVLVRFDIKTEKFQSWTIPGGGGVVRNMKSTRDGNLVIAESGVNKVGLVLVGSKEPNSSR